jgi:hypothetical protein
MKLIKTLSRMACAMALLGGVALAADSTDKGKGAKEQKLPACCEKAKAEGKECTHKCCVEARKDGKICEKCAASNDKKKEDKKDDKKA